MSVINDRPVYAMRALSLEKKVVIVVQFFCYDIRTHYSVISGDKNAADIDSISFSDRIN